MSLNKSLILPALVLLFSFIVNWFFFWHKVGISFFVFTILWMAGFEYIKYLLLENNKLTKFHLFTIPILFFSSVFIFRTNYLALFLAGALYWINTFLYVFLTTNPNFLKTVTDFEIAKMLGRALISIGNIFVLPLPSKKIEGTLAKKIIIALGITFPIITIVTLLLASADEVFSNFLNNLKDIIIPNLEIPNIMGFILALALTFLAVSYVRGFIDYANKRIVRTITENFKFTDLIIPTIITYSLNIVYLVFAFIQFRYLFGGQEFAISQGIVYSEYAIKGFWEMMAVCFINFGILYLLVSYFSLNTKQSKALLLPSYVVMILSSLVMIYSSHSRLSLYESGYGFTIDRVIPHAFLIFILAIFILQGITLLYRDNLRNKLLILGTFVIANLFIAGFTIFPMEKFIVRQNIARAEQGKELDKSYLLTELDLEGYNEILEQIKAGKLEKELLQNDYALRIIQEETGATSSIEYDVFQSKIRSYEQIKESKWQSWNLEYSKYLKE